MPWEVVGEPMTANHHPTSKTRLYIYICTPYEENYIKETGAQGTPIVDINNST